MHLILITERAEGGGPLLTEGEIVQQQEKASFVLGDETVGAGKLFITTEYVTPQTPRCIASALLWRVPLENDGRITACEIRKRCVTARWMCVRVASQASRLAERQHGRQ